MEQTPSKRSEQTVHAKPEMAGAGRIELLCGCMFAGKTGAMIRRLESFRVLGARIHAYKHALDQRYAEGDLATHDQHHFPARAVPDGSVILRDAVACDVVAIDEGHFFGEPLVTLCTELRERGLTVLVAGLDRNAWGRLYPAFVRLKAMADTCEVLHLPCRQCGAPALYSQRVTPVINGDMVGGPGDYEPRCEACFVPLDIPPPPSEPA